MLKYGWGSLEQDYLVIVIEENWRIADFVLSSEQAIDMLATVKQNTKILIDLRRAHKPPSNFMLTLGWFFESLPANVRSIIVINSTSCWHSVFQVSHRVYARYQPCFYAVRTVDEAYQLIVHEIEVEARA